MSEVWFNDQDIVKIDGDLIEKLKAQAEHHPRKRARFCLHKNTQAEVHEMVIAVMKEAYVRPHKHKYKTESFHVIRGSLWLCIFNDKGDIVEKFRMSERGGDGYFLYRLEKNYWHTIIPITDFVAFHEVTKGPFNNTDDSIFPDWAPKEGEQAKIDGYVKGLLARIS